MGSIPTPARAFLCPCVGPIPWFKKGKVSVEPEGPLRPVLISGFRSMKRLGVFMLPPGWDASPSQGYPQHYAGTHLYTWVERSTVRVKCLAQEHNTMSPARPRTRTTRSGVEHTNHEATAPPTIPWFTWVENSTSHYPPKVNRVMQINAKTIHFLNRVRYF